MMVYDGFASGCVGVLAYGGGGPCCSSAEFTSFWVALRPCIRSELSPWNSDHHVLREAITVVVERFAHIYAQDHSDSVL